MVSDIADLPDVIPGELPLNAKRPLFEIRRVEIRGDNRSGQEPWIKEVLDQVPSQSLAHHISAWVSRQTKCRIGQNVARSAGAGWRYVGADVGNAVVENHRSRSRDVQ